MTKIVVKKSLFDRWNEYIEKAGGRSHKYIRKIPNSKGGWNYIYPADFKKPIKALLSIFGMKEEKIDNAYEKNDIQNLYGASKETFAAHILEYLSNRAKWNNFFSDKKTRESYKAPGKTTGGNKTKTPGTSKEDKQEWNKSLMRKIYSLYNKVPEDNNTPVDTSLISVGDKITMQGRTGVITKIQDNGMGFVKFDDGAFGRFKLTDMQKIETETPEEEHENRSEAMMGNDNAAKDGPEVIEDPIAEGYKYNFEGKTWTITGFGADDAPIMVSDDGERIEFDSMAEFDELYQNGELTNAGNNGLTEEPTVVDNYESTSTSNTIGGYKLNPDDFEYLIDLVDDVYSEVDVLSSGNGNVAWDMKNYTAVLAKQLKNNPVRVEAVAKIAASNGIDDLATFFAQMKDTYDNMVANGNYYRSTDLGSKPRDLFNAKGQQIPLTYSDINLGLSEEERNQVYDEMRAEREADDYASFDADKFGALVQAWQTAIRLPTVKEQNMNLLKIYSLLEDENWHTENQMLLDGKFAELNQMVIDMRTQETIWKEKNGILDRIKENKTVGKEYFDHLRATTSNADTRAAIDQAEKEYNEDQRMAQYRLESDRWDAHERNYNKERANFGMRDNFKTREEVETALNNELKDWNVTPENLRENVIGTDNFDSARQARIDYLTEKLNGFNATSNYGTTFPPSIAGNLPTDVTLDEIIKRVGNSTTVSDNVVDQLVKEKTGYSNLWDLQRNRVYRDTPSAQKWANVQEIIRLQTRKNQGMDVVDGKVVTKVKDINGMNVKEGDIVKISNSYTQNENGLFRVQKLWDRSDGTTFSLTKVKKDGTDANGKYNSASWPMNSTYSNNPRFNAEYRQHNGKNGENVKMELYTISDEARQKGIDNATKEKGYQFTSNGIRTPSGDYTSVYYSLGDDGSVHVSSSGYGNTLGFLNTETDKVRNDTDSMTDYFDKDDITVTPSNPYYKQIKRAALKNQISSMKKRLEDAKKDVERYSGSGKNYYNAEYYLKEAKKIVSDYPSRIAGYEKDLKAVEKELKPKTVKKSFAFFKDGRFFIQKSIPEDSIEWLEKGRDLSKLQKVQITDKNGHKKTVYKRAGEMDNSKQPSGKKEEPKDNKAKYSDMLEKVKNGPEENALFVRGKGMLNKKDAMNYLNEKIGGGSKSTEKKSPTSEFSGNKKDAEGSYNQSENAQNIKMAHVQKWDNMIRKAAKSKDENERIKVAEQIENEYKAIKKQKLSNDEADYVEFFHNKAKKWLNGGVPDGNVAAREMPNGYVASLPEKVQNQLKTALREYNIEQGMDRFESAEAIDNVMDSKISDLQDLWNENQEIKTILWNAKTGD